MILHKVTLAHVKKERHIFSPNQPYGGVYVCGRGVQHAGEYANHIARDFPRAQSSLGQYRRSQILLGRRGLLSFAGYERGHRQRRLLCGIGAGTISTPLCERLFQELGCREGGETAAVPLTDGHQKSCIASGSRDIGGDRTFLHQICQSASNFAPRSTSKSDPAVGDGRERVALAPAELVWIAQPGRAR